jgi:hypothetical protein
MNLHYRIGLAPQRRRPDRTKGPGVLLNDWEVVKRSTLSI